MATRAGPDDTAGGSRRNAKAPCGDRGAAEGCAMGDVLQFPGAVSNRGYTRARRSALREDPNQLSLFAVAPAAEAPLTPFEQALLFDEQEDGRAAELYQQAIENNDSVADAYCNLGILESRLGKTARAFDCFTRALKQDPRHGTAHYNLANLYLGANEVRLAQLHYEMATRVTPTLAAAHFNLSLVRAQHGDRPGALDAMLAYRELVSDPAEIRQADTMLGALRTASSETP